MVVWWEISEFCTNKYSNNPVGTMQAKITPMTMLKGISRSVNATVSPDLRACDDASESLMPLMMGPMIFTSVQMAATVMAPAPTNRTSWLNVVFTISEISPEPMASAEKTGSSTP